MTVPSCVDGGAINTPFNCLSSMLILLCFHYLLYTNEFLIKFQLEKYHMDIKSLVKDESLWLQHGEEC